MTAVSSAVFQGVFHVVRQKNKKGTSKVGLVSKAQKAPIFFLEKKLEMFEKKFFFRKMSHSVKKIKSGDL